MLADGSFSVGYDGCLSRCSFDFENSQYPKSQSAKSGDLGGNECGKDRLTTRSSRNVECEQGLHSSILHKS
ncbi:hypothetical protein AVEN_176499-1, partial [Araneus ventricosus]